MLATSMFGACGGAPDQKDPFSAKTDDEYVGQSTGPLVVATSKSLPDDSEKAPVDLAFDAGGAVSDVGVSDGGAVDGGSDGGAGDGGSTDGGVMDGSVMDGSTGGDTGGGGFDTGSDAGPSGGPSGFWRFDDCSPTSHFLADSSGGGANATHALKGSCKPGISGGAIEFKSTKDIVQVPDEPQFTLGAHVAVAAWVKPTNVTGHHPIALKRLGNDTGFSLGIHDGNVEFSVVLSSGTTVLSRAPIATGAWTHVAGLYDGRFLFLFVNGEQVGQVLQVGTVRNVFAPIRIGSTTGTQHFDGLIDEVWLSTRVVSKSEVMALSCIAAPPTLSVTTSTTGAVPPDTTVHYDAALTNHDVGACAASSYFLSADTFGPKGGPSPSATSNTGISALVSPSFVSDVAPGGTAHFGIDVTGSEDADPGLHEIPLSVFDFARGQSTSGVLDFTLSAPTGCHVTTSRELMITSTSVVDDPVRTSFSGPAGDPRLGVWTFGRLIRDMAPSAAEAPAFTEKLLQSWLTNQTVNGFTIAARPAMQKLVLDAWPRTKNGELDLDRSPLRLLAIVDRVDVRDLDKGNAGEGRFVFGVLDPSGNPLQFTVILEYKLPATTTADVLGWANAWHALGALPFPSEAYNVALQALTSRFAGRNAASGRPNGSALGQLRTNEIALDFRWELREFTLSPTTGQLAPSPIQLTPDLSFNGTDAVGQFVNDNEAAILAERFDVPLVFNGAPFLGGAVFNDLIAWTGKGIKNDDARHKFSLNTCNGCHSSAETNTAFLQISPRFPGSEAALSPFLTGTTVFDPVTGVPRVLRDLARRKTDLEGLVCLPTVAAKSVPAKSAPTAPTSPTSKTSISKGIGRVH